MKNDYLELLFFQAIETAAVESGSLNKRLAKAYRGHLYKIMWESDLKYIPEDVKLDFQELRKIFDDAMELLDKKRDEYKRFYHSTDKKFSETFSLIDIIKEMDWRKSQRAIELMCSIYFLLKLEK